MRRKTVVVTGGGGYLGCILTPKLLEAGYRVRVLDLLHFGEAPIASFVNHPACEILRKDINCHDEAPDLFKDAFAVIHLASLSNDPSCDLDPALTIRCNFLSARSLASRAKAEGVHRFIFASSCSVYGAQADAVLDEHSPTEPITLYALTKLTVERELIALADDNFCVGILRLATLFGYSPRMRFDLAINIMIKRCLMNEGLIVNGHGEQYRPFLHVQDAAAAFQRFLTVEEELINREVYNIGSEDNNYTILALAEKIQSAFPDQKIERVLLNRDSRSYRVSFQKVAKRLGLLPVKGIDDAIREIRGAYHDQLLPEMDHPRHYNLLVLREILGSMTPPNMALPSLPDKGDQAPAKVKASVQRAA